MKYYTSTSNSNFSLSSVNYVYNDEGIPVHRDDYNKKTVAVTSQPLEKDREKK